MTSSNRAVVSTPTETQIVITREFAAPRELVFRAWTTPECVARWWAGDRGTVTSVQIDLTVGGTWRYVMVAQGGFEVAFHGEYREIEAPARLVSTEVYEGAPEAGEALNTLTLVEEDGRTILTIVGEYPSRDVRDMVIESGMEAGMQEAMTHLEEVALSLA